MSFNYGNPHRTRGKHFKLFSDELPKIDLDKLEDNDSRDREARRSRGAREGIRDPNNDFLSLPSLKSPDWDQFSDLDGWRPRSNHSSTYNTLNPNFSKIHQKIRKRNTFREPNVSTAKGHASRTPFCDKPMSQNKQPEVIGEASKLRKSRIVKDVDNHDKSRNGMDVTKQTNSEKPSTPKHKSVLKELLEASAKENLRMNQIREGLDLGKVDQRPMSLLKHHELQNGEDHLEHTDIGDRKNFPRPGILRHGVRLRHTNSNTSTLRPRLFHQDVTTDCSSKSSKNVDGNEVKISLVINPPLSSIKDIPFVPLPSLKPQTKAKRVNFHEVMIKEITAVSDGKLDENRSDLNQLKTTDNTSENKSVHAESEPEKTGSEAELREESEQVFLKTQHRSVNNKRTQVIPLPEEANDLPSEQKIPDNGGLSSTVPKLTCPKSHATGWKELKAPDDSNKQRHILTNYQEQEHICAGDSTPISHGVENDKSTIPLRDMSYQRKDFKCTYGNSDDTEKELTEKSSRTSDVDSMSNYLAFLDDDDFNFGELPEEVDRSLLGEDLIKAYRLWDRKRRKFSTGIRKIDAPWDKASVGGSKSYGKVKTYRITSQSVGKATSIPVVKTPRKNALVEWV